MLNYVVSTQVRGGLTFREGHYICEAIHETGLLVGLDIMVCLFLFPLDSGNAPHVLFRTQEVNPSLEDALAVQQTVAVGCSLARAALGEPLFV